MDILHAIAAMRTPFGEKLWQFLTFFGEETFIVVVLCILFWCVNKNLSYKIGATFFLGGLLTQGLKITLQIPRPWVLDPNFKPVGSAIETATSFSFPSGHTASAGSLFFPMALSGRRWWRLLALMPFVVGFSRMYLGVHTLLDVGCALAITAVFAAIVQGISQTKLWDKPQVVALGLLAFSAAVLIYAFCRQDVTRDMLEDCIKAAAAGVGFAVGYFVEKKWVNFDTKAVWWMQIIKVVVGLAVVLAIKSGLKLVLGETLIADAARYFLLIVWIIVGWPALFNRFKTK
jgi:undecaprenyl-diphosphatase